MRESQMKKIIALAVAGAFVAPVYAADVTIGGDFEWSYQDNDGATSTSMDNDVNIKVSGEADNGISFAGDFNFNSAANHAAGAAGGNSDGSHSLTISGPFGTVDLGDTDSAIDAINAKTEISPVLELGTGGDDAAIKWTLPTIIEGMTVNVSHSAETNHDGNAEADGVSVQYAMGNFTVGYGQEDNGAGTSESIMNATYTMGGIYVAYEQYTSTSISNVDTDTTNIGLSYTMDAITLGYETSETKEASAAATEDATTLSVAYNLGGGLQVFAATQSDDITGSADDITAVGAALKF